MPTLGPLELAIILVIIVLIFGAGKLPELGGALGRTFREFRSATREIDEIKEDVRESVALDSTVKRESVARSESVEKKA